MWDQKRTHTSAVLNLKIKINYLYLNKKRVSGSTILISIQLSQQLCFEQLQKKENKIK